MLRTRSAAILAMALVGCSNYDKMVGTSFMPTDTGFVFKGVAGAGHPIDSESAEAWRIGFLESYLSDNHLCPAGYEITDRKPILVTRGLFGDVYDVIYTGRCKA